MTRKRLIIIFLSIAIMLLLGIQEKEEAEFNQRQQELTATVEEYVLAEKPELDWQLVIDVSLGMYGQNGQDTMLLYPDEDGNIYLPAFADLDYIRVYFTQEDGKKVFYRMADTPEKAFDIDSGGCFMLTNQNSTDKKYSVDFIVEKDIGYVVYEYTFYQGSANALFLTTGYGMEYLHESRDNLDYQAAMVLLDRIGQVQYDAPLEELRSRGNTTWEQFEKKPYQIKLGREEDTGYSRNLFEMGKHKTWCLLALWQDEGFMATATAYKLAENIGLPETSKLEFVDLYIDGEYRGVYGLTEKVSVDEHGVAIRNLEEEYAEHSIEIGEQAEIKEEDNVFLVENDVYDYRYQEFDMPEEVDYTSGYLLELDGNWFEQEKCWFITRQGAPVVLKQPESVNQEQIQYVSRLFQDLEDAIYSETGYNSKGGFIWDYADRNSWLKYFTIQEMMMNWDGYHSSTYFYIDIPIGEERPKIYAGPLWDMDHSAMSQNIQGFTYEESLDYNTKYIAPALYDNRIFMAEMAAEYGSFYHSLRELLKEDGWYDKMGEDMGASFSMDYRKWENGNALDETREKLRKNLLGHAQWLSYQFQ